MNCEDVPMSEWDKLTGAREEVLLQALAESFVKAFEEYFPASENKGFGF